MAKNRKNCEGRVTYRRQGALERLKKQLADKPVFTFKNGGKKETDVKYVKSQIEILENKLKGAV
jgi:hypothetical protein